MADCKAEALPWYEPCSWVWYPPPKTRMFISGGMAPERRKSSNADQPEVHESPLFQGKLTEKVVTCDGGANVLKRYDVTTPNDEPAPRSAQNRSAFSVEEQFTAVALASTTVAPTIQSRARP